LWERPAAISKRTSHRRDFAVPPPEPTILDIAESEHRDIVSIGKIDDIFGPSWNRAQQARRRK